MYSCVVDSIPVRAILLESAVDDTLSVVERIQDELGLLIEKEGVHDKERFY